MRRGQQPIRSTLLKILAVLLLPILLPLALVGYLVFLLHRAALYLLIWAVWVPKGRDTLIVYSESPLWHEYMTQQVLPLVKERAVILNWSQRASWRKRSLAFHVFRSFGGYRAFNPIVILFRPLRRAAVFRFWEPFNDWKRGYTEPVERLRSDLAAKL